MSTEGPPIASTIRLERLEVDLVAERERRRFDMGLDDDAHRRGK
jgi:hypothetical protein